MKTREQTVLVISDDPAFCAAARRELQGDDPGLRVSSVSNVDAARLVVEDCAPGVILLELAAFGDGPDKSRNRPLRLNAVISSLAAYAPVVVLGSEGSFTELSALVAAGAADYVPPSKKSLEEATGFVRRRLEQAQNVAAVTLSAGDYAKGLSGKAQEDFGEILRHELNNPLTGILGNAELLLVELRRSKDGSLPQNGMQRLETIAALAVRMRETIRLLSQEWEGRRDLLRAP